MTFIAPIAKGEPGARVESHVCDGCGIEVFTNGMGKPRGWAMVLQKGESPAKHYCNSCKPQKKSCAVEL